MPCLGLKACQFDFDHCSVSTTTNVIIYWVNKTDRWDIINCNSQYLIGYFQWNVIPLYMIVLIGGLKLTVTSLTSRWRILVSRQGSEVKAARSKTVIAGYFKINGGPRYRLRKVFLCYAHAYQKTLFYHNVSDWRQDKKMQTVVSTSIPKVTHIFERL